MAKSEASVKRANFASQNEEFNVVISNSAIQDFVSLSIYMMPSNSELFTSEIEYAEIDREIDHVAVSELLLVCVINATHDSKTLLECCCSRRT